MRFDSCSCQLPRVISLRTAGEPACTALGLEASHTPPRPQPTHHLSLPRAPNTPPPSQETHHYHVLARLRSVHGEVAWASFHESHTTPKPRWEAPYKPLM